MKRKLLSRYLLSTLVIISLGWIALTFYVERTGPSKEWVLGKESERQVLIVYDPDPFYNLDEKVCMAFAKAMTEHEINVRVASVAAAQRLNHQTFDALIYCANTYNWRPDWSITGYIEDHNISENSIPVVAITLGAGSTQSSQQYFEKTIINSGGKLMASYSLWLWRPNDETRMKEPNVEVAVTMAYDWGKQIAERLN